MHRCATGPAQQRVAQGGRLPAAVLRASGVPQDLLGQPARAAPVAGDLPEGEDPGALAVGAHRDAVDAGAADDDGSVGSVGACAEQGEDVVVDDERATGPRQHRQCRVDGALLLGQVDGREVAARVRHRGRVDARCRESAGHRGVDDLHRGGDPDLVVRAAAGAAPAEDLAGQGVDHRGVGLAAAAVDGDDDLPRHDRVHGRNSWLPASSASVSVSATSYCPTSGCASSAAATRSRPPCRAACSARSS